MCNRFGGLPATRSQSPNQSWAGFAIASSGLGIGLWPYNVWVCKASSAAYKGLLRI